jgi:hypothetical protein
MQGLWAFDRYQLWSGCGIVDEEALRLYRKYHPWLAGRVVMSYDGLRLLDTLGPYRYCETRSLFDYLHLDLYHRSSSPSKNSSVSGRHRGALALRQLVPSEEESSGERVEREWGGESRKTTRPEPSSSCCESLAAGSRRSDTSAKLQINVLLAIISVTSVRHEGETKITQA